MSEKDDAVLKSIRDLVFENKDHDTTYQRVCDVLSETYSHYSWTGIYIVEGDNLILKAWTGDHSTEHTKIKIGEGICGLAADTGKTVVVPDVTKSFKYIMCFAATKSEIVVPIKKGSMVYGEIDIDSDQLDAFDRNDEALLEKIAEILATLYE